MLKSVFPQGISDFLFFFFQVKSGYCLVMKNCYIKIVKINNLKELQIAVQTYILTNFFSVLDNIQKFGIFWNVKKESNV